jgi:hypothetical protein
MKLWLCTGFAPVHNLKKDTAVRHFIEDIRWSVFYKMSNGGRENIC